MRGHTRQQELLLIPMLSPNWLVGHRTFPSYMLRSHDILFPCAAWTKTETPVGARDDFQAVACHPDGLLTLSLRDAAASCSKHLVHMPARLGVVEKWGEHLDFPLASAQNQEPGHPHRAQMARILVAMAAGAGAALAWWLTRKTARRYTSIDAAVDPDVVGGVIADPYEGTRLATVRHSYCATHSSPLSAALQEVWRRTEGELQLPRMLSSPLALQLLQALIRSSGAKQVLEIGTYTGFTAIGMAEALPEDGQVLCLDDFSDEAAAEALCEDLLARQPKVELRKQTALQGLEDLAKEQRSFDLVYIDADKENQIAYVEALRGQQHRPLLAPRGSVVVDNTLWYSRVLRPSARQDEATKAVVDFNTHVLKGHWHVTMLPVRDGVTLLQRK